MNSVIAHSFSRGSFCMYDLLRQDATRYVVLSKFAPIEDITPKVLLQLLHRHMALRAIAWFRLGSQLKQKGVRFFPAFIQRLIYSWYGLEILVGAPIGGGLYIAHPIGAVISPRSIGKNCSIIAAVTIGMRNEWDFPRIGDNVFIGAGARVLGGISIGDGAAIGANAVVINDVPPGTTAVGIPARIVRNRPALVEASAALATPLHANEDMQDSQNPSPEQRNND
jgi:serine O-acetyltransferase